MGLDDFEILKVIGKGSFGKVFQVKKVGEDEIYAMKVLNKSVIKKKNQIEHTKTERNILGKIDHPFIVGMKYAFQTVFLLLSFSLARQALLRPRLLSRRRALLPPRQGQEVLRRARSLLRRRNHAGAAAPARAGHHLPVRSSPLAHTET